MQFGKKAVKHTLLSAALAAMQARNTAGPGWREPGARTARVSFDEARVGMTVRMKPCGQDEYYTGKILEIIKGNVLGIIKAARRNAAAVRDASGCIRMRWNAPAPAGTPPETGGPPAQGAFATTRDSVEGEGWWDSGGEAVRCTQRLTAAEYIDELQRRRDEANTDQLSDLLGRLCYGACPDDFHKLSNPAVKTCFLMGGDGLKLLLDCAADRGSNAVDMLLKIGYDVLLIYNNARCGRVTNLVVFHKDSISHQPATWAGASTLISDPSCFPLAAPIVAKHAAELRTSGSEPLNHRSYQRLEEEYQLCKPAFGEYEHTTPLTDAGKKNRCYNAATALNATFSMDATKLGGKKTFRFDDDDWRYGAMMTERALAALDERGVARPCHSRAFLMHFCGMNPLFGGDGFALAEGKVRVLLFDDATELKMWAEIKQNLYWPEGQGPDGPWPPQLTRDIRDPRVNKVVALTHDRLVRVSDAADPDKVLRPITCPGDLPAVAWDVVFVDDDVLQEYMYIAPNMVQGEIPGLVSVTIGSPTLEQCVRKIASLLGAMLENKYRVPILPYHRPHNWVPDSVLRRHPVVTRTSGRLINGDTGCIADGGRYVGLTPEQFAARYTKPATHRDELQNPGRVVKQGERLGGVGFRIRCVGSATESTMLARGHIDRGLKVSGPAMLQQLPRNCLDCLLTDGFKPLEIYEFLMKFGMSFTLDVFPWELWKEGDEPEAKRHFPTTREGIQACLQRYFPDAVAAFKDHSDRICATPPTLKEIRKMQDENGKDATPMTYQRFRCIPQPCELDVRHFLYSTLSLGPDWCGNAASHGLDPDDRNYQYLTRNDELSTMRQEGRVVTIPLGAPSPDQVITKLQAEYKRMRERVVVDDDDALADGGAPTPAATAPTSPATGAL